MLSYRSVNLHFRHLPPSVVVTVFGHIEPLAFQRTRAFVAQTFTQLGIGYLQIVISIDLVVLGVTYLA